MATIEDLGKLVKAKYPEYNDLSDADLGRKVRAKYPEYSDFTDTQLTGFEGSRTPEADIKSAERYKPFLPLVTGQDNPLTAGGKATVNLIPSAFNLVKNLGSAAINVANPNMEKNTIANILRVGAGGIQKLIPGKQKQEKAFEALAGALKERYGGIDNLARTATNDPFAFGSEIVAFLQGGAAVIGKQAQLNQFLSKVAQKSVIRPVKSVLGFAENQAAKTLGFTTGAGKEPIKQAFREGSTPEFTQGLRGQEPETILTKAETAFSDLANKRGVAYRSRLAKIKTETKSLDVSSLAEKEHSLLENFNIKEAGHKLTEESFRQSAIANDPSAIKDIIGIHERVHDLGLVAADRTPLALDALKRQWGDLYSKTSNSRAFVTGMKKQLTNLLEKNVKGYAEMTADYNKASDLLNDIKQTLSLGGNKAPETVLSKLTRAIQADKGLKKALLNELGTDNRGLINQLAGNALTNPIPGGLFRKGAGFAGAGKAAFSIFTNPSTVVPLLLGIGATSPRIVGEFLRALGMANNKIQIVLQALKPIATKTATAIANPAVQGSRTFLEALTQNGK